VPDGSAAPRRRLSITEGRRNGKGRHFRLIASDLEPLDKAVRALRARDRRLHFVYEAGPSGFGIPASEEGR